MSDTSESVVRRLREELPTIDAVCRRLEQLVDAEEAESLVAFGEIFLSKATKEFLHERSADSLAYVTLGAWRFLMESEPDCVDEFSRMANNQLAIVERGRDPNLTLIDDALASIVEEV